MSRPRRDGSPGGRGDILGGQSKEIAPLRCLGESTKTRGRRRGCTKERRSLHGERRDKFQVLPPSSHPIVTLRQARGHRTSCITLEFEKRLENIRPRGEMLNQRLRAQTGRNWLKTPLKPSLGSSPASSRKSLLA